MRLSTQLLALLLTTLLLGACGFHLREQVAMPFKSIYVATGNPKSPFIAQIRFDLEYGKVAQAAAAKTADVVLQIVSESSELQILTLDNTGLVTEYRLIYRVSLRAYDNKKQDWIPSTVMELHRDFFYDNSLVLAKSSEQDLLARSMYKEMAQQILRRLSLAKPQPQ